MPVEIEAKVQVRDFREIRAQLRQIKARPLGERTEINRFYDMEDESLRRSDRGLRLRSIRGVGGGRREHFLTYKGPRRAGRLKRREEIEIAVADPAAVELMLERLGYARRLVFRKRRESWRAGKCRVELDTVAGLGRFVEVEGPTAAAIGQAVKAIGLGEKEFIRESYPQLLERHVRRKR